VRWSLPEFILELQKDPLRKVLFVEGGRDISIWKFIVPVSARNNGVIYPISSLECEPGAGGERGRLMRSASTIYKTGVHEDRVRFFADADADRLLGKSAEVNVTLTDGRDLESYGLVASSLERFCEIGFPSKADTASSVIKLLEAVVRPLGVLRVASDRNGLKLPFQRTFEGKGIGRFIDQASSSLDLERLLKTLLQNATMGLRELGRIRQLLDEENARLQALPLNQLAHGKDVTLLLAWRFGISQFEAERLLFMALSAEPELLTKGSIGQIRSWLVT